MENRKPTIDAYKEWQYAYDYFNRALFDETLPDCLIVLDGSKARTLGYFVSEQFINTSNGLKHDCIAMNPKRFLTRDIMSVLSTLVHEMCHVWEYHNVESCSRSTYHNAEWGTKMESIGLMPSNTGAPGGKRTGQQMSHYVIKGGRFEVACKTLLKTNFNISWADRYVPLQEIKPNIVTTLRVAGLDIPSLGLLDDDGELIEKTMPATLKGRIKYKCPNCGTNIWGKPKLNVVCGDCNAIFEAQK